MRASGIRARLFLALVALCAGAAALILAIQLVRSVFA